MTETSETPETPTTNSTGLPAFSMPIDPIKRCRCGVPAGTAHYCAAQDHNWVKAPAPADDAD
jgi:hypothetical protein